MKLDKDFKQMATMGFFVFLPLYLVSSLAKYSGFNFPTFKEVFLFICWGMCLVLGIIIFEFCFDRCVGILKKMGYELKHVGRKKK